MSRQTHGKSGSGPSRSYAVWPASIWLAFSVAVIAANYVVGRTVVSRWLAGYAWITFVCSLVAAMMFWIDKRAAIRNKQRISERALYIIAAIGGWPGAVVGQHLFRHKTQKVSFRTVLWLIVIFHVVVAATLLLRRG